MAESTRPRFRDDAGATLIELIVATVVFGIFASILTGAIVGLTRGATRAEIIAQSANSVLTVFQNLDRDVRYADAINYPGVGVSGAEYIEFRIPAQSAASGVTTCTQWRFVASTAVLQVREWSDQGASSSPTAWSTQLTKVVNDTRAGYPFAMVPARIGGSAMQQFRLSVDAGTMDPTFGAEVSTGFVALNSSIQSPSNSDALVAGTSDAPVCQFSGSRP